MRILTLKWTVLLFLINCMNIYGFEKDKAVSIYKEKLIIADFANKSSYRRLEKGLNDDLITLFAKTKRFDIIERDKVQSVLKEQELYLTGVVRTEDAVRIGQMVGAKYIIFGSITSCDASHSEEKIVEKEKDTYTGKIVYNKYIETTWEGRVRISSRLVEIETGKVLLGKTVTGKSYEKQKRAVEDKTFLESLFDSIGSDDDEKAMELYHEQMYKKVVNSARQNAAIDLVEDFLQEFPLSGYVISRTEEDDFLIDLGPGNGMNSLVNLKVLGKKEEIKHPVTGEVLAIQQKEKGYLKVVELGKSASKAKIVRGDEEDIEIGAKVEVVEPIFIWHRALTSFLLPGLGQFLEKRWSSGILFFLGESILISSAYYFYYRSTDDFLKNKKFVDTTNWTSASARKKGEQYNKARNQALAGMWIFISLEILLHAWDVIDAGYPAEKNDVFAHHQEQDYYFSFLPGDYEDRFYFNRSFRF